MNLIDPVTLSLVHQALDASSLRQAAYAHNIANAHTENFRPLRVTFEEHLSSLRDGLSRGESASINDAINLPIGLSPAPAGSRVELESEVSSMSQNALHYQALIKAIDRQFGMVSLAVSEGRK